MKNKSQRNSIYWSIRADDMPLHRHNHCLNQPLPNHLGTGHSNFYRLDDDLSYIETLYTPTKDLAILSRTDNQEPRLVVTLGLKGQSRFASRYGEEIRFNEGYTTITCFSSSLGERHFQTHKAIVQLRFSMSKKWVDRYFGENTFRSFAKKGGVQTLSYQPITAQGLIVAQQLLNSDVPKAVRRVFIHGQVLSILAAELIQLNAGEKQDSGRYKVHDMAMANSARDILCNEFRNPPSVEELAKRVGTNQFKLKQLFHTFFNTTPYSLLLEIRMNNAYRLLESRHCQVSVAADYVGYNHASNFSTAFIKHFGVAPKLISRNS